MKTEVQFSFPTMGEATVFFENVLKIIRPFSEERYENFRCEPWEPEALQKVFGHLFPEEELRIFPLYGGKVALLTCDKPNPKTPRGPRTMRVQVVGEERFFFLTPQLWNKALRVQEGTYGHFYKFPRISVNGKQAKTLYKLNSPPAERPHAKQPI